MPLFFELVEDFEASNFLWVPQVVHADDGTQRSDEPVSKSMRNGCAGVPMVIVPAHSTSSSSVNGSF